MDMSKLILLLPTMEIIEEAFQLAGWSCISFISAPDQLYRNVRLYTGSQPLHKDVLYTLRPGETGFPTDEYAYICSTPLEGKANHIFCPDAKAELLLDFLLELYSRFQQSELAIDQLSYRGANLQELCQLGEDLLENPVCIHDDWFILIGLSQQALPLMAPEFVMSSDKRFLPRAILEDFQHDSDYLETYSQTQPQIWTPPPPAPTSLYVNLWDGSVYRGRLVVLCHNRPFRKADMLLAQVLTQRAIFLLRSKHPGGKQSLRSMDDIVFSLLSEGSADPAAQTQLLQMLGWGKNDPFLCIRIRSQQENHSGVLEHVLHSDLFQCFPGSYILMNHREQCLILNLDRIHTPYPHLPHVLAPLCRDYGLYAGISSPVSGIQEWHVAYRQAGIAIDSAFRLRCDRWIIPFSQCALEHILSSPEGGLQPGHMVAPELRLLAAHDREKGTQYFETFREYLLQERDIPRTAEKLIIHRTTLLYRLKKIHSIISVNLEDPWQRLYLIASLWIMEKEHAPDNRSGSHPERTAAETHRLEGDGK